jgi:hypothetical protein
LSSHGFLKRDRPDERVEIIEIDRDKVLYLPVLSASEDSPAKPRGAAPPPEERGTRGLSYPGPQTIISDVPRPTNNFQTLLQPALVNPPVLKSPIQLPNIMQMTNAGPLFEAPTTPPMQEPAKMAAMREPQPIPSARLTTVPVTNPLTLPQLPQFRASSPPMAVPSSIKALERPDPAIAAQITGAVTPLNSLPLAELRATAPPMVAPATLHALEQPNAIVSNRLVAPTRSLNMTPSTELRATAPPMVAPATMQALEQPNATVATRLAPTVGPLTTTPSSAATGMRATAPPQTRPATLKELEAPGATAPSAQTTPRFAPIQSAPTAALPTATAPPIAVPKAMAANVPPAEVVTPAPRRAPVPTTGLDPRNLLSITPLPPPPDQRVVRLPAGEARGRVAISPDGNLSASSADLGVNTNNPPSSVSPSLGKNPDGPEKANTPPANTPPNVNKTAGADDKRDGAPATGNASASAPGRGGNPVAGPTPMPSAFPGITIMGGRIEPANPSAGAPPGVITLARPGMPPPPVTNYNMTIVATAGSGGGLPDFGVFANEQVYTVFVDVKPAPEAPSRSWTLQYAVSEGPSSADDPSHTGVTPPFPMVKEYPRFAGDLVRSNSGRLVVVYAVIDTNGKLQQLSVKQTPESSLGAAALASLEKWTFRPAELNGRPVPAKILLGIPLAP